MPKSRWRGATWLSPHEWTVAAVTVQVLWGLSKAAPRAVPTPPSLVTLLGKTIEWVMLHSTTKTSKVADYVTPIINHKLLF